MRAIVHIGMPKTGSTTLQSFLQINRRRLASRGVFFRRYRPFSSNQIELLLPALSQLNALLPGKRMRAYLRIDDLNDQLAFVQRFSSWLDVQLAASDAEVAVFSSEHLYMWMSAPDRINALDSWLRDRFSDVTYLAYVRSQEDYLFSLYSEAVKLGHAEDFSTFLEDHGDKDHWQPVTVWADTVGDERLTVRGLDDLKRQDMPLIEAFCQDVGIDREGLRTPANRNLSLSENAFAPVIAFNKRLSSLSSSEVANKIARMAFIPILRRLYSGNKLRPDPALVDKLRQKNADQKQAFVSRFLG